MSYVTTVVIIGRYIPQQARDALAEGYADETGRTVVAFGSLSDYTPEGKCDTWTHWRGGKGPESYVFGGAFNYLDDDRLKAWLATVPWYGRVDVIVLPEALEHGAAPLMWVFAESRDGEHG